jgi:rhodanese-related sulfurtransferase
MSIKNNKHEAKQRIYEQFARVGKALSAPARLELLDLLMQSERSVDALAREANLSVANASQHLQVLHAARLVDSRREGQRIYYRIADGSVERLWSSLREAGERQLAELDAVASEYLQGREQFEPIERSELLRRLKAGTVVLIDVRPREEYEAAHLAGAVSVPMDKLRAWASQAPKRKQVVAYCRGPYCVYALNAVTELRKQGVNATRLEDGVIEWRLAGLPLEGIAS